VDKLLSIIALLSTRNLAAGLNPIRQIAMCLFRKNYVAFGDQALEALQLDVLNSQDQLLLMVFSIFLVEQIPKAKLTQQERYSMRRILAYCRMKAVRPLRESSDDLAHVVDVIIRHDPWDVSLVEKALHCYRTWVDYAVHEEEVKFEVLFPYMVLFMF
jgi:hypothetical protein